MNTTLLTPAPAAPANAAQDTRAALRFVTCGSVDDGKSTLIGRLLVDSKTVLQDQLAGVQRSAAHKYQAQCYRHLAAAVRHTDAAASARLCAKLTLALPLHGVLL